MDQVSKPDALALADSIDPVNKASALVLTIHVSQAAAELRRLHNALRVAEESLARCTEVCNATAAHWREDTMRLEAENEALRRAAESAKDLIVSYLCHQAITQNQWKAVVGLLNNALKENNHD